MKEVVFNMSRRELIQKAVKDCLNEMYYRAQPSADFNEYLRLGKEGKISRDENVWMHHYLSKEYYDYIIEKYINAYRLNNEWKSDIDFLVKDLKEGCIVDKYIHEYTDENGNYHPGHRGYDERKPLKDRLQDIVKDIYGEEKSDEAAQRLSEEVFDYIENRKNFYRFDREEDDFRWTVGNYAPSSINKDKVIEYWKSKGQQIDINDIDPRTFYMIDEGWSEEEINEELKEYEES